jgi:hypothetical protein
VGIEHYYLSDLGGTTFTQVASTTSVSVNSGSLDDLVISAFKDVDRNGLTVDLSSGGNDTVFIRNDTGSLSVDGLVQINFGGFGGTATDVKYNDGTLVNTATDWTTLNASQGANTYSDIHGFIASASDNGRDTVQLEHLTGGYVDAVNRTTTDLSGVASGSVLEINSASFTVSGDQFGNLQSIATMLDSLSNVGDGNYYIMVYNGQDTNADAALYYARATEGDGLDFADTNGLTGGYDTDSLELLSVFHDVGANTFSSLNFQSVALV